MSDASVPKKRSSRRHGARLLNQLSGGNDGTADGAAAKCSNPFNSDYEQTDRSNTRVSALSLHGTATTTSNGYSVVEQTGRLIDYETVSKQPTCCLHGKKCSKNDAKSVQRSREACEEDTSGAYETANKFLQMKNISKADIQSKSVTSLSSGLTDPLKSVIENGIDESAMENAFRRRRGVVAPIPTVTPGFGYEAVAKTARLEQVTDTGKSIKNRSKTHVGEELYVEPDFNAINRVKRQVERERDTGSDRVEPLLPSSFATSTVTSDYGYELIADSAQARQPIVEKMKVAANYDPHLHKVYLGELTPKDAELRTKQKGTFKLYHQLPSAPPDSYDALEPGFKLFIVYRNSKGDHYHFPIVGRMVRCVGAERQQITVEYGEPAPFFNSLTSLVKFYETYVMLNSSHSLPDIFPWWLTDPSAPPRSRRRNKAKLQT